jgi:hypothetical protein
MHGRRYRIARLVALVLLAAVPALAQVGRVSGTVKDEEGHPIKGSTVLVENKQVAPGSFTAVTDDKGRFSIVGLRTGIWTVTVSAPGFEPQSGAGRLQGTTSNPPLEFRLVRSAPIVPTPLAGVDMTELQASLGAADAQLVAGRYDDAIASYQALLAKVPVLTSLNLQIAEAYRGRREYDRALTALRAAREGSTSPERIDAQIGLTQFESGDVAAAEATLAPLAARPRPDREALLAFGNVRAAQRRPGEASALFDQAAAADPAWAFPHVRLAEVAAERGDAAAARLHAERALELEPDGAGAARARAVLSRVEP